MKVIIFDLDNTLLDTTGQTDLILSGDIDSIVPFSKTIDVLKKFQDSGIHMALVTYDNVQERQYKKIEALGISTFFEDIYVCKKPEEKHDAFENIISKYKKIEAKNICVVGDRIDLEIMFGNMLGCTTIQLDFGKYSKLTPENEFQVPKYKIHAIEEVCDLIGISCK